MNLVVLVLREVTVPWPGREVQTVGVGQGWPVAGVEGPVVVVVLDFAQIVGQTLQVVSVEELLVTVQVLLTTEVLGPAEFLAAHEPWELATEEEVVAVETDVLREVVQTLLVVVLVRQVEVRVVVRDDVRVVASTVLLFCKPLYIRGC